MRQPWLSWTNGAGKVQWGDALLSGADHAVYAHWQSQSVPEAEVDAKVKISAEAEGVQVTGAGDGESFADGAFALPDVTVDDAVAGKPVVKIADYAFNAKRYDRGHADNPLRDVKISTYVREIGSYAFAGCASVTNVTFAPTRDYGTGAGATLVVRDWAFRGSPLKEVRFPAGSTVVLEEGAFAYAEQLEDIYLDGDVQVAENARPFLSAGKRSGRVTVHLSPALAADRAYVLALTNGMNAARVSLSQEVEGRVEILSSSVTTDPMTFTFQVAADSPWVAVGVDSVYLFWSRDLEAGPYIGNDPLYPTAVADNGDGTYTATFAKPAEARFFQLCVGAPR